MTLKPKKTFPKIVSKHFEYSKFTFKWGYSNAS